MSDYIKIYFWLKLKDTFFSNPKIKKLRRIAGGDTFTIIYLKLMLLSLKNNGLIELDGLEPTVEEEIALILDEEVDNIRITLSYLKQAKLIDEVGIASLYMVDVPTLTGKETDSAERKRKQRGLLKSKSVTLSQACHKSVHPEIELEKEIELDKDSLSKSLSFPKFRKKLSQMNFTFTIDNGVAGFLPSTKFSISSTGYIHNIFSGEDVNRVDAQKIWDYLYSNRQKLELDLK